MARVVVLGGAESGVGAAVLAKVKGHDVFLSDKGKIKEEYANMLRKWEIPFEEGHHTEELILNADEVVKSPGIPGTVPMVQKLRDQGTHIVSEIEFASRYDSAKKICVTGSNGKTTTTSLIYYLLQNAGLNVGLGGNIGKSYAYQVATEHFDYYVLEIDWPRDKPRTRDLSGKAPVCCVGFRRIMKYPGRQNKPAYPPFNAAGCLVPPFPRSLLRPRDDVDDRTTGFYGAHATPSPLILLFSSTPLKISIMLIIYIIIYFVKNQAIYKTLHTICIDTNRSFHFCIIYKLFAAFSAATQPSPTALATCSG